MRDWEGDLSGNPRLVGAEQAASPRTRLLGAPPLTTMRASRAFRLFDCVSGSRDSGRPWSYWARAVLLALSCCPPQSLIAEPQQARKRPQRLCPSKVLDFLKALLGVQSMARRKKEKKIQTAATPGGGCGRAA